MMKDNFELAREAGLTVVLDGKIGREDYRSVSGSMEALVRFAVFFGAQVEQIAARDVYAWEQVVDGEPNGVITKIREQADAWELNGIDVQTLYTNEPAPARYAYAKGYYDGCSNGPQARVALSDEQRTALFKQTSESMESIVAPMTYEEWCAEFVSRHPRSERGTDGGTEMNVELKPCPLCGEQLEAWGVNYRHNIDSGCFLASVVRVTPTDVEAWNNRAASAAPSDGRKAADERAALCDRIVCERNGACVKDDVASGLKCNWMKALPQEIDQPGYGATMPGVTPREDLKNDPLWQWRCIAEEAEVIVNHKGKFLMLSEEMCVCLGSALEEAAKSDSHLASIMERNEWRNAMVGLCSSWPKTAEEAAEHLRQRLHREPGEQP